MFYGKRKDFHFLQYFQQIKVWMIFNIIFYIRAFELKHINKPDRFELNKQIISIFAHYYI